MTAPRYLLYSEKTQLAHPMHTLAAALKSKARSGGTIYEPLRESACEEVAAEFPPPDPEAVRIAEEQARRDVERLHEWLGKWLAENQEEGKNDG